MKDPLQRIYRLKVILVAIASAILGLLLIILAKYAESAARLAWLREVPLFELGSTLFITGAFVVVYDYLDGRDKETREDARITRLLIESAPAMRDAVVRGFAVQPDDLKRVATPEILDDIVTNALGLRLEDPQFAAELNADIRDQVVRARERWYDVEVTVRLSSAEERDAGGVPRFDVLVEWEYTVRPLAEAAWRQAPSAVVLAWVMADERATRDRCLGRTRSPGWPEGDWRASPASEYQSYLEHARPLHELLRQWCGHRAIRQHERLEAAEAEVHRLDLLLQDALTALEKAGNPSRATALRSEHDEQRITVASIRPVLERPQPSALPAQPSAPTWPRRRWRR